MSDESDGVGEADDERGVDPGAGETARGDARYVVPDPEGPPDGEPTTFVPPASAATPPPAPVQPGWQPPTQAVEPYAQPPGQNPQYPAQPYPGQPNPGQPYPGQPYPGQSYPPNQAQAPQGQTAGGLPSGPPTAVGPTVPVGGWTQQQPPAGWQGQPGPGPYGQGAGQPPGYQQAPGYQSAPGYQQPQTAAWGTQAPPPSNTKGGGAGIKVVIGVLIALLVAAGSFLGVSALINSGSVSGTVDECRIDPDGTLTASGTVSSDDEIDQTLSIRFDDADTGVEVDRAAVDVAGGPGDDVLWTARGQAGENVNRVTCVLGPLD
ncbi:MAG: hypothetical protein R2714_13165 [Microthrixaceae bacterium]